MDSAQSTSLLGAIQDENTPGVKQLNKPTADGVNADTIHPVGHIRGVEQTEAESPDQTVGSDPSDTFTSVDDTLVLPLKKKKQGKTQKLQVIPLTTIPVQRLPSPPPVTGQEGGQEKRARRRSDSFLASACREPAWFEDVFDKETIENTRMNLGSLTLRGHSKDGRAMVLKNINQAAEVAGTVKTDQGKPNSKGKTLRWGETTIGYTEHKKTKKTNLLKVKETHSKTDSRQNANPESL